MTRLPAAFAVTICWLFCAATLAVRDRMWRQHGRRLNRPAAFCLLALLAALWGLQLRGIVNGSVGTLGDGVLILASFLLPIDDDDDPPKRRLRSALKRAREVLAHGVPAVRPETG